MQYTWQDALRHICMILCDLHAMADRQRMLMLMFQMCTMCCMSRCMAVAAVYYAHVHCTAIVASVVGWTCTDPSHHAPASECMHWETQNHARCACTHATQTCNLNMHGARFGSKGAAACMYSQLTMLLARRR